MGVFFETPLYYTTTMSIFFLLILFYSKIYMDIYNYVPCSPYLLSYRYTYFLEYCYPLYYKICFYLIPITFFYTLLPLTLPPPTSAYSIWCKTLLINILPRLSSSVYLIWASVQHHPSPINSISLPIPIIVIISPLCHHLIK